MPRELDTGLNGRLVREQHAGRDFVFTRIQGVQSQLTDEGNNNDFPPPKLYCRLNTNNWFGFCGLA